MKMLIFGISGLTGYKLAKLASKKYDVYGTYNTREITIENCKSFKIDIVDDNQVDKLISHIKPDVTVNTTALHNVDYCEENKEKSFLVNAKGDLFLFLSQDRIISSNWLDKSVTKILTEQNVGCVFGKVIAKGTSYDEYGAAYDIYGSPCMKGTTETTNLFYAGGAILVRSDIIEKIGAFDPKFFMYQEDIDLCWRIRLAGYRIEMVDDIECKNIGGGVSNTFYVDGKLFVNFDPELIKMPVYRFYHSIAKNRMRVLLKNYSLKNIIRRLPTVLGLIILRGTLMSIKTRNPFYFTSAFKGIFWNALYLRDTLNHRKKIQKYRKVNDQDIEKHMINRSIELESIGRLVND